MILSTIKAQGVRVTKGWMYYRVNSAWNKAYRLRYKGEPEKAARLEKFAKRLWSILRNRSIRQLDRYYTFWPMDLHLYDHVRYPGAGNRARRRMGLEVIDTRPDILEMAEDLGIDPDRYRLCDIRRMYFEKMMV